MYQDVLNILRESCVLLVNTYDEIEATIVYDSHDVGVSMVLKEGEAEQTLDLVDRVVGDVEMYESMAKEELLFAQFDVLLNDHMKDNLMENVKLQKIIFLGEGCVNFLFAVDDEIFFEVATFEGDELSDVKSI